MLVLGSAGSGFTTAEGSPWSESVLLISNKDFRSGVSADTFQMMVLQLCFRTNEYIDMFRAKITPTLPNCKVDLPVKL